VGTTIGVAGAWTVVLGVTVVLADGGPAGTIGGAGACLPLDGLDDPVACDLVTGARWPFGITIGVDEELSLLLLL
jgi:hypothetical protein